MLSLQMNSMSDKMKSHLPPTDSRFRPDMISWENAKLNEAMKNQKRMSANMDKRRAANKELLKHNKNVKMDDDRTYYNPRYFIKTISTDDKG